MIRDLVSAGINRSGAADMDLCSHDFNQLKDADIIIASIYLGYWSANVSPRQVTEIQRLFDTGGGVDIVIGHSPTSRKQ
jgi:Bacterial capsule synthesis protein PGA_cap